jgi:cell filamentation protein
VAGMKKKDRYDVSDLIEAQSEPGSGGRVLKNLLGIKRKREMDQVEAKEYIRTLEKLSKTYDKNHRFDANDICNIHRIWMGNIYKWAGKYRQVNASKGGFLFAAANQIPQLMQVFEEGPLHRFTPCIFDSKNKIISAIATVHTELVIIHPFREGNGRVARILATFMALQAGLPVLDFGGICGKKRQEYFSAVRSGLDRNYEPMEKIFTSVIRRTFRSRQ